MGITGKRTSWIDFGPKHCLLCADTYMCGADASTGVLMASWETHKLSLLCKPLHRGGNALSLTQSHSLGVQMLSSQASQGLSKNLVILDGGRTAALLDGLSARYGLPAPCL